MNKHTALCLALAAALVAPAQAAGEDELRARIDRLASELETLKNELNALKARPEATAPAMSAAPPAAIQGAASAAGTGVAGNTTLVGYGEINMNAYRRDRTQNQVDIRRAVFGIAHQASARTRIVSELEVEHAVTSADDAGEVAVEQLYVEHQLNDKIALKGGLFLIPMGFLNLVHEPTNYYGVERNFVETAIIPSTWREVGLSAFGVTEAGLRWDVGLTTGFDFSKWDATEGRESPLGAIHQEGQNARSKNLSTYASLAWRGTPGLDIGGAVFTGKAGHGNKDEAPSRFALLNNARLTLWDMHARWTPGRWDLAALYARGTISNTGDYNLATTLDGVGNVIPRRFFGWYGQAAYHAWKSGEYALTPFVRHERFNTAAAYSSLTTGLSLEPGRTERVWTVGANLKVGGNVVLKADYQRFKEDRNMDRINLGLGYSF